MIDTPIKFIEFRVLKYFFNSHIDEYKEKKFVEDLYNSRFIFDLPTLYIHFRWLIFDFPHVLLGNQGEKGSLDDGSVVDYRGNHPVDKTKTGAELPSRIATTPEADQSTPAEPFDKH
ncbi:hypothetical protein SAY86_024730 [Trapa natans]|uniref:Uncharacterized protein n=1 Tax=Trapa natans TaxID=22666 RepID=A0AAN7M4U7_TRANT|nr:hypothetical protein SAY86_024730 [Trapa natans]